MAELAHPYFRLGRTPDLRLPIHPRLDPDQLGRVTLQRILARNSLDLFREPTPPPWAHVSPKYGMRGG